MDLTVRSLSHRFVHRTSCDTPSAAGSGCRIGLARLELVRSGSQNIGKESGRIGKVCQVENVEELGTEIEA